MHSGRIGSRGDPATARPTRVDGLELVERILIAVFASLLLNVASAKEAVPESPDPVLEARMVSVTSGLRCLVCQNQTIADSHADLAVDLRAQVREQLKAGRSDAQIVDYMTARYGDFVLYRPPFKPTTALLWLGPAAMLAIGLAALVLVLRRRSRLAADAFEPDDDEPAASPDPGPRRDLGHV